MKGGCKDTIILIIDNSENAKKYTLKLRVTRRCVSNVVPFVFAKYSQLALHILSYS